MKDGRISDPRCEDAEGAIQSLPRAISTKYSVPSTQYSVLFADHAHPQTPTPDSRLPTPAAPASNPQSAIRDPQFPDSRLPTPAAPASNPQSAFRNPQFPDARPPTPDPLTFSLLIAGALAIGVTLAGCDLSGEYEKKFQDALTSTAQRAAFDQSLYPNDEEVKDAAGKGTGVRIRIPKLFDKDSKSLRASDQRAHPPFMQLPGLNYTRERQLDDSGGQFLPAYAYFGALPKGEQKGDAVQAALAQQVAAALPGAAWADAQLKTPDGQTITLKRLRAAGQQDFVNLQKNAPQKADGRFDLYLVEAPAHHVLIGWRAPKAQAENRQFDAAAEAAMGTVTTSGGADAGGGPPKAPGCF
jgi:hypothetical protein